MIIAVAAAIDRVLDAIHGDVVLATALGIGKSDPLADAPYRRTAARRHHPPLRRGGQGRQIVRGP